MLPQVTANQTHCCSEMNWRKYFLISFCIIQPAVMIYNAPKKLLYGVVS